MLAQQLLAVGRVNEALDVTTVALDVDKDDPDLLVVHGHALQAGGYPALARIAFERTVRVAPEWNKPWRELAYLLLEVGKLEQAGRVLDRALERHYGDESVWDLCDRLVARVREQATESKAPRPSPAPRRSGPLRGSSRGYDPRRSGRYHPPTPAELFPGSLGGTDTAPVLD
jgi:Flp pilus assembly protein TadD